MKNTHLPITLLICMATATLYAQGQLLLKSGFESAVQITDDMADITGLDAACGFDWDDTPAWIESSRFAYLVNRDKNLTDYMASFIENAIGPHGNRTRVLCLQNKADDPDHASTSRNEYSFFGRKPPNEYREGYVKYWMKLQANLEELVPRDRPSPWYMIMEWKEPNSGIRYASAECRALGQGAAGSNNYRININIRREKDAPQFRWHITGEHPQPCRKTEWAYTNPDAEVPLGKWFLLEAYMKKDAVDGRVYFAVDGRVVLDTNQTRPRGFTGRTQHADNPLELRFWSPMKNYHHMDWNKHGPVSQWYDDFELWTSFPPSYPAR